MWLMLTKDYGSRTGTFSVRRAGYIRFRIRIEGGQMTEMLHVEAARIPDRDKLLGLLLINGIDAKPVGEVEIEVPCADGNAEIAGSDLLGEIETAIMQLGAPFVPTKHEDVIYIRPPVG